jgi:hypothetical protein
LETIILVEHARGAFGGKMGMQNRRLRGGSVKNSRFDFSSEENNRSQWEDCVVKHIELKD